MDSITAILRSLPDERSPSLNHSRKTKSFLLHHSKIQPEEFDEFYEELRSNPIFQSKECDDEWFNKRITSLTSSFSDVVQNTKDAFDSELVVFSSAITDKQEAETMAQAKIRQKVEIKGLKDNLLSAGVYNNAGVSRLVTPRHQANETRICNSEHVSPKTMLAPRAA